MNYYFSYIRDKGDNDSLNQDSLSVQYVYTECGPILMGIVADGIGSLYKSENASKIVCTYLNSWFIKTAVPMIIKGKNNRCIIKSLLRQLKIINETLRTNYTYITGSTVAVCIVFRHKFIVANIGDSSVFVINRRIKELTHKDICQTGELCEALGTAGNVNAHFITGKVYRKSVFIICSDGFEDLLNKEDLVNLADSCRTNDCNRINKHLNEYKNGIIRRGGFDDISAILVYVK